MTPTSTPSITALDSLTAAAAAMTAYMEQHPSRDPGVVLLAAQAAREALMGIAPQVAARMQHTRVLDLTGDLLAIFRASEARAHFDLALERRRTPEVAHGRSLVSDLVAAAKLTRAELEPAPGSHILGHLGLRQEAAFIDAMHRAISAVAGLDQAAEPAMNAFIDALLRRRAALRLDRPNRKCSKTCSEGGSEGHFHDLEGCTVAIELDHGYVIDCRCSHRTALIRVDRPLAALLSAVRTLSPST